MKRRNLIDQWKRTRMRMRKKRKRCQPLFLSQQVLQKKMQGVTGLLDGKAKYYRDIHHPR